MSVIRVR